MKKYTMDAEWHRATLLRIQRIAASCKTEGQFKVLNTLLIHYRQNYKPDTCRDHHDVFHFLRVIESRRLDTCCVGKEAENKELDAFTEINFERLIKIHVNNFQNTFNFGQGSRY